MILVHFEDVNGDKSIVSFKTVEEAEIFIDERYWGDEDDNIFNARLLVDYEVMETYKKLYEDMKDEFFKRELKRLG